MLEYADIDEFFILLEAIDGSLDRPPIIHIDTRISVIAL